MIDVSKYVGIKYTLGGKNVEEGFDCWSFVKYLLQTEFGVLLDYSPSKLELQSHRASAKWIKAGRERETCIRSSVQQCTSDELKEGGLVLMGKGSFITHIGVYLGNYRVIHCQNSKTGGQVVVWPMKTIRRNYPKLEFYNHVVVSS